MERYFNTAGPCLADRHYMLPAEERCRAVRPLIRRGLYFSIHAPRQTGKTTLIRNLARQLNEEGAFAAVAVSMESFTEKEVERMAKQMVWQLTDAANHQLPEPLRPPALEETKNPHVALKHLLSAWAAACPKPLVLLIDEVDALQGPVLLSLLRQLRDGYCSKPAPFPHSVALVGMRDVRDYKASLRSPDQSLGTSSPFNIKSRSLSLDTFTFEEVKQLLAQHTEATGQIFAHEAVEEIFNQSQGQPWLTNALAAQLTTEFDALLPDPSAPVTRDKVLEAKELLIQRRDTHLDSLVARLQEDRVRRVLEPILTGDTSFDQTFDDDFTYVKNLGLVSVQNGNPAIANPIYQEILPRILSSHIQAGIALDPPWFIAQDGGLDVQKLLDGFIQFWRRNGEVLLKGMSYHEAAPHLVLMAYLQRVINGGGQIHREFALGTGRADLVVELGGRSDVIELKIKRGKYSLPDGLEQVSRYAKRLNRPIGYLILFDRKSTLPWDERGTLESIEVDGIEVVLLRA